MRRKPTGVEVQSSPASAPGALTLRDLWFPVALLAGVFLIYYNSLGVPFIFDDEYSVVRNVSIRQLWPLTLPLSPPYDAAGAAGRPLFNLSLAINYAVSGLGVRSYHLFNIGLHAANALLLWMLLRSTLRRPGVPAAYRAAAGRISACVVSLWAAHPLLTIAVTVTQQRTELMGAFFILLSLYAFSRSAVDTGVNKGWSFVAITACAAGMASKETAACVPILALFYDRTFIAGSFATAWKRRGPLLVAMSLTWILLLWVMLGTNQRAGSVGFGLGVGLWEYLLTQCDAIVRYLGLSFWPKPLIFDYGVITVKTLSAVLWQAALVVSLLAGTVWALVRHPVLGFLGLVFFLVLAPSSSFLPVVTQTMGEQRMYLPLAVVMTIMGLLIGRWVKPRFAVPIVLSLVTLASFHTVMRNRDYATEIGIWRDTLQKHPGNIRAYMNLAASLHAKGQAQEAIDILQATLDQRMHLVTESGLATQQRWDARIYSAMGEGWALLRRYPEAEGYFNKAIELNPRHASAYFNLGKIFTDQTRYREAAERYEEAIRLKPDDREAMLNFGRVLILMQDFIRAERVLATLVDLEPRDVSAGMDYADSIILQERYGEGRRLYQNLQRMAPANHRVQERLSQLNQVISAPEARR